MVEAEQSKQLDSVTDVVHETEVDAAKAKQAMTALSSANKEQTIMEQVAPGVIHKEDVSLGTTIHNALLMFVFTQIDLIVDQLDCTEELAQTVLCEVAVELKVTKREGNEMVVAALRKLVKS